MSRDVTTYRVLLSAPSDVTSDVELIRQCFHEINLLLTRSDVRFDPFYWSTDVTPGMSSDAQSRINDQASGFDIIIAVFGTRIGSPTKQYASGTVEEVEIAISNRDSLPFGGDSIIILFKDVSLSTNISDLSQAAKVQEFRKSLADRGLLYGIYEDDIDLRETIMASVGNLRGYNIDKVESPIKARHESPAAVPADVDVDTELGFLDYEARATELLEEMGLSMAEMGSAMSNFSADMEVKTKELATANTLEDRSQAKIIVNEVASRMLVVRDAIDRSAATLSEKYDDVLSSYRRAFEIVGEDMKSGGVENLREFRENLQSAAQTINASIESVISLQDTIAPLPRVTKQFNLAKRSLLQSIERYLSSLELVRDRSLEEAARIDAGT